MIGDMTTMGDAIAIVDCSYSAVFYAGGGSGKVVLFCKKGAATNYMIVLPSWFYSSRNAPGNVHGTSQAYVGIKLLALIDFFVTFHFLQKQEVTKMGICTNNSSQ